MPAPIDAGADQGLRRREPEPIAAVVAESGSAEAAVLARCQRALAELLPESGPVLAAVSGGADSMALLDCLVRLRRCQVVYHLDHALRPESRSEAALVAARVAHYRQMGSDLQLISERHPVPEQPRRGPEDAARALRYGRLEAVARAQGVVGIALGHHRDDQAETVLHQLLRGCGPAGAPGMPAWRWLGPVRLVRPLLACSRRELREFLRARGLGWSEDASNRDQRFTRNRLRHAVLPEWERAVPGLRDELIAHARRTRDRWRAWDTACAAGSRWQASSVAVAAAIIDDPLLSAHVARQVLEHLAVRVDRRAVARVVDLLRGPRRRCYASGDWLIERSVEGLRFRRRVGPVAAPGTGSA